MSSRNGNRKAPEPELSVDEELRQAQETIANWPAHMRAPSGGDRGRWEAHSPRYADQSQSKAKTRR